MKSFTFGLWLVCGLSFSLSSFAGKTPDPFQGYWRKTFSDEFKGPDADTPLKVRRECFNAPVVCSDMYNYGNVPCSNGRTVYPKLQALNKCIWKVHRSINWMSPQINEFDPGQVEVRPNEENGVMLITGKAVMPDGSTRTSKRVNFNTDALKKDKFDLYRQWMTNNGYHCEGVNDFNLRNCPIRTGMVTSRSDQGGFKQQYGLIQVRGTIAHGDAAWPAYWMLPDASWPGGGEFDLMESWNEDRASQTFHGGVCIPDGEENLFPDSCKAKGSAQWHLSKGEVMKYHQTPNEKSMFSNYHNYSLEWDDGKFIFRTDGVTNNAIHEGDQIHGSSDSSNWFQTNFGDRKHPVHVPKRPFYVLLNHSIGGDKSGPDPELLTEQTLKIDYVRAWSKCVTSLDYCPQGGSFTSGYCTLNGNPYPSPCTKCLYGGVESGPNCQVEAFAQPVLNPGATYWVDANPAWPGIYYKQIASQCPYGGVKSGNGNCQAKSLPGVLQANIQYWADANPSWPGVYYKQINGNCSAGGVKSGNGNCQIVALEKPSKPFVVANVSYWVDANPAWPGVYYKQTNGNCNYGGVKSGNGNCQLVSFPAGKLEDQLKYWVDANPFWPGVYYRQAY